MHFLTARILQVTDPDSRLPALEKCLKKLYLSARVNCFVTATPSSFLLFGKENSLDFRAFVADVDRIKAAGFETGDHIVLHPSCESLTDKDFDKLSGFLIPQIQAGVRDMYALSQMPAGGPTGLLGLFAINHVHNPCDQFSNCDMARIVVHGLTEQITRCAPTPSRWCCPATRRTSPALRKRRARTRPVRGGRGSRSSARRTARRPWTAPRSGSTAGRAR